MILKGNWGQNFTPVFFIEIEPFTKIYVVLNIYLKVVKLRSLERLDEYDAIPANVYNMLSLAVHDVLEQKLIWFESLESNFRFPCFFFRFCFCFSKKSPPKIV